MELTISNVAALIALLVSISATYNAYVLRGGRLAWSQVLTALGTVCLMFSLVLPQSAILVKLTAQLGNFSTTLSGLLYILGFLLLFSGSLKLRASLK
ncbi:hypothetical protein HYU92_01320 [Candidatus Curtissbacteria bacterium]|nr:hypothetical protein [Candidatus Curtissbacteria bacterium]